MDDKVSTRVGPPTAQWLADRAARMHTGSVHLQVRAELELLQSLLSAELRRVRLTVEEASCIADVLNGLMLTSGVAVGAGRVYAECYDAFRMARETPLHGEPSYGSKWGIDEDDLLRRLGDLGPTADYALRDAMSRWWEKGHEASVEGFAAVGLRVVSVQGDGSKAAQPQG
ncbi:hypothetical protein KBX50_08425 [Micromonospora sp. C51]|uniref:hypothetical protein n=1 Tax=Micromonospora sp. C51 TaxID=2824879 RepID=UPI001B36EF56|nr:hypothetical protein [Micromonospora sp. C51]MBQ1048488.1 hypothetical protein [Micromonospora sp. C51]